jgi:hypothetical protein
MINVPVGGKLELLVVERSGRNGCSGCCLHSCSFACSEQERKDGKEVYFKLLDQKTGTQQKITDAFNSMRDLVLEKNKRYGDAALTPKQVFSKLDAVEGLKIRLDDKISRIMNNSGEIRKNDVADIMGYLVLLAISQNWLDFSDLVD